MTVVETERPVVTEITRRDVLHRAADLLEEFGWCQFAPAKDEDGWPCSPLNDEAQSFCLTGSVERAIYDFLYHDVRASGFPPWLKYQLEFSDRPRKPGERPWGDPLWNNAPGRTKAEVVARLRAAAEAA